MMNKWIYALMAISLSASAHADNSLSSSGARIEWACQNTGNDSMQCQIRNTGTASGGICMDVVKVCGDGDHVASNFCSGQLGPGEADSKVVHSFWPHKKLFSKCIGIEFRNKVLM